MIQENPAGVGSTKRELIAARQAVMRLCALGTVGELQAALEALSPLPDVVDLRAPEAGLIMLRGRTGGDGAQFNLGEASVARAAVRLANGTTGFGYLLGRDLGKARLAAILDALCQDPNRLGDVEAALAPIGRRVSGEAALHARQTAATRVNFFTLVRGED